MLWLIYKVVDVHLTMISFVYSITDKAMKDYIVYKPYLVFFGLMNGLYTSVFKVSSTALYSVQALPCLLWSYEWSLHQCV